MFKTRYDEWFEDFSMVLDNGCDVDMTKICSCENAHTMDSCEKNCPWYHQCDDIAIADDILVAYEEYPFN